MELIVRSRRKIGQGSLPDHCIFERSYTHSADFLTIDLLELVLEDGSLSGPGCLTYPPDFPDDYAEIRAILVRASGEYIDNVASLLGSERYLSIELKLIPEQYDFQIDSHVDPKAERLRVRMAVPVAYDASVESSLALSMSVIVHESMHMLAHGTDFFDSMEQEELFGYTLDRCFRIQAINDFQFWAPNFQSDFPEHWLDGVVSQYGSVDEILANIDDDEPPRVSVQGLGTAMVLFGWATHRWREDEVNDFSLEQLLNDWCDIVLADPIGTFSSWPGPDLRN